jgi:3-oxoacyl-[acyl-carrier-protein] synthase III
MLRTVITGTGSYIPPVIKKNNEFIAGEFYTANKRAITSGMPEIIEKFRLITGIEERRYAPDDVSASDMAAHAARLAIEDSGIDPESIDQIIVAHNYGDIKHGSIQSDSVPSIASRVKHALTIRNSSCVPYDILFGCPGWLQGFIQADAFIRAGLAGTCLIIGTETLSRVIDVFDRDSMIFSDGAGAFIVQNKEVNDTEGGFLGSSTRSDCMEELDFINFDSTYAPDIDKKTCYIKMQGRKVYEYALKYVPAAMKECLEKSGVPIDKLKKIFIHQANEKMDEAIVKAFYRLYNIDIIPEHIMPMSIQWLGNSSVATIPTLYDLVLKGQIKDQAIHSGDIVMFASVGAGMNINAVCYRHI